MVLADAIQARIDDVSSRLQTWLGDAWVEPVRVCVFVRAKSRTDLGLMFEARFTFEHVKMVVSEAFLDGYENWTIRIEP